MIARLTTGSIAPDRIEEHVFRMREMKVATLRMDGCQDMYLLLDRRTGTGIALSLWESEEKLRAAETTLNQQRDRLAQASGSVTSATSEVFEVID